MGGLLAHKLGAQWARDSGRGLLRSDALPGQSASELQLRSQSQARQNAALSECAGRAGHRVRCGLLCTRQVPRPPPHLLPTARGSSGQWAATVFKLFVQP